MLLLEQVWQRLKVSGMRCLGETEYPLDRVAEGRVRRGRRGGCCIPVCLYQLVADPALLGKLLVKCMLWLVLMMVIGLPLVANRLHRRSGAALPPGAPGGVSADDSWCSNIFNSRIASSLCLEAGLIWAFCR